jgi:hypothetical protein
MSQLTSLRRALVAIGTSLALIALSAGQVLANTNPGPFPK